MRTIFSAIVVVAMACAGCTKPEEATPAGTETKAATTAKSGDAKSGAGPSDAARAFEKMGNLASGSPDGRPADPVSVQALQSRLPNAPGWEAGQPEGQHLTTPVPFSQAQNYYRKDGARIEVTIVDTGFSQSLISPWSRRLIPGHFRETQNGYEKATTIAGNPAIEKWNKRLKRCELNVLVDNRFMVTIEGHDVRDVKEVQDFAANLDFKAIAAVK